MSDFLDYYQTWKQKSVSIHRGLSSETLNSAGVTISGSEAILPYGIMRQSPDRFKIINIDSKAQFFTVRSPIADDDTAMPFFNQRDFDDKSYIIITEGEWDCLSWIESGLTNSVSLPNGITAAPNCFRRWFSYFTQFNQIYINFDADKLGKGMVETIKTMIPRHKFRNISFDIIDCKDANAALLANYSLKEFFDNAERVQLDSIIHASEIPFDDIFNATPKGMHSGFHDLDQILGGFRSHELTTITGDTASGKTTLAAQIAYNITEMCDKGVWISSQEMRPSKLLEKIGSVIIKQAIRDGNVESGAREHLKKVFQEKKIYINPNGDKMTLDSLLESLDFASYAHGISFAVIEDLGYLTSSVRQGEEREKIEYIMQKLHAKVIETGMHILIVAHPTQSKDDKGFVSMAHMKGSSGIKQYSDNVLIVQRLDRAFPKKEVLHKYTLVSVAKNRALGTEGKICLEYHKEYDGFSPSMLAKHQITELCR